MGAIRERWKNVKPHDLVNACMTGRDVPLAGKYLMAMATTLVKSDQPGFHDAYQASTPAVRQYLADLCVLLDNDMIHSKPFVRTYRKWVTSVLMDCEKRSQT